MRWRLNPSDEIQKVLDEAESKLKTLLRRLGTQLRSKNYLRAVETYSEILVLATETERDIIDGLQEDVHVDALYGCIHNILGEIATMQELLSRNTALKEARS